MALLTTEDLIKDALDRAGEPINGTSAFQARTLDYINRIYLSLAAGGTKLQPTVNEDWWWFKETGYIDMFPPEKSGTVTVAQGSTTVTFNSAQLDPLARYRGISHWFRHIKIDGDDQVLRGQVTGNPGTHTMTLDAPFAGPTLGTADYAMYDIEHVLPTDLIRMVGPIRINGSDDDEVVPMGQEEMHRDFPITDIEEDVPTAYAVIGIDMGTINTSATADEPSQVILFNKGGRAVEAEADSGFGDQELDITHMEFTYIKRPEPLVDSDASYPLIPREHRHVLADYALAWLFTQLNDDRAVAAAAAAEAGLMAMVRANRAMWRKVSAPRLIKPRGSTGQKTFMASNGARFRQ